MSVRPQRLVGPALVTNAAVSYFTATVLTRLDKVVVSNPDAATGYTIDLYIVPQGSAADAAHDMVPARALLPSDSQDITQLEGITLNAGDQIFALASVTNKLNLLITGMLFS